MKKHCKAPLAPALPPAPAHLPKNGVLPKQIPPKIKKQE